MVCLSGNLSRCHARKTWFANRTNINEGYNATVILPFMHNCALSFTTNAIGRANQWSVSVKLNPSALKGPNHCNDQSDAVHRFTFTHHSLRANTTALFAALLFILVFDELICWHGARLHQCAPFFFCDASVTTSLDSNTDVLSLRLITNVRMRVSSDGGFQQRSSPCDDARFRSSSNQRVRCSAAATGTRTHMNFTSSLSGLHGIVLQYGTKSRPLYAASFRDALI